MKPADSIDPNEIVLVKTFFSNPVWKRIEQRLEELRMKEDSLLGMAMSDDKPVGPNEIPDLNYHKAKRRAFFEMQCIKEEMLEAVDEHYGEEPEEKSGFDVKKPE